MQAKATVKSIYNSEKMTEEECVKLVQQNQDKLQLTEEQFAHWAVKRYIVLIEVDNLEEVEPFSICKKDYGNMHDWLPVEEIDRVRWV